VTQSPYPAGSMPTNGRYGWYKDHLGVERQRISTLLKHVETDRWALENWGKRQTAVGLARREDLLTGVKAIGPPGVEGFSKEQKSKLDGLVKKAEEAAKDVDGAVLGTAAHDATERIDRGEPVMSVAGGMPYPWNASLQAYAALRRLNGWINVEIERTVEVDELDIRGTFDRVDLIPGLAAMLGPGECQYGHVTGNPLEHYGRTSGGEPHAELPVVVDVKTEEKPWLNGIHIGPQLAGYSRACRMWVPGVNHGDGKIDAPGYVDMPCVRQDVGIVVHVRDGDAVPYFINLIEGWEAALAAAAQRDRLARSKRALGTVGCWLAPMPGVVRPRAGDLIVEAAAAKEAAGPRADPDWMTLPPVTDTNLLPTPTITEQLKQAVVTHPDNMRASLIEAIWQAADVAELSRLYELAKSHDVPWEGPAAMAGAARQRQIQCVQRAMHDPATTAKCACGWMRGNKP
jgi:hypothetical protein